MTTGAMTVTIVRGNTYRYNRTIKSHGFRFDYGRKIWFSFPAATPDVFDRLSKSVGKGCIVEHRDVLEFWFPEKASLSYPITRCDEPIVDHQFVSVWTDGGCWPNPGIGGWAYVIVLEDGQLIEDCGFEENTTNNRMELMGPIKALQRLPVGCTVKLTSDSQYMLDGLTTWIDGWKSNGWRRKKSNGKDAGPVSNAGAL